MSHRRLLVVQVAALGHEFLTRVHGGAEWLGLRFRPIGTVFPALTCPVQASLRTATAPGAHGMTLNGVYVPRLRRPMFWEQSSALVAGGRIWEGFRAAGGRVGVLFWQQSLGEDVDVLLSPAPIHKHGGGMVDAVYSRPEGLYGDLVRRVGRRFRLSSYWGPLARLASTRWIARATAEIMAMPEVAPDLLLTYLPHLDYALQKHGPESEKAGRALRDLGEELAALLEAARRHGYDVIVFGDYAMGTAREVLFPNRLLRAAGLLRVRRVGRRLYPDFHYSRAFAIADHEVTRVIARDEESVASAVAALTECGEIVDVADQTILTAGPGRWFAYPWWGQAGEAPDYATHIDIHNKPGYDPRELLFGRTPFAIGTDAGRVRGTHGLTGPGREIAFAAVPELDPVPGDLVALASATRSLLESIP